MGFCLSIVFLPLVELPACGPTCPPIRGAEKSAPRWRATARPAIPYLLPPERRVAPCGRSMTSADAHHISCQNSGTVSVVVGSDCQADRPEFLFNPPARPAVAVLVGNHQDEREGKRQRRSITQPTGWSEATTLGERIRRPGNPEGVAARIWRASIQPLQGWGLNRTGTQGSPLGRATVG
jgi:hypothetical protein